jgi:hypothetical protein
MGWIGAERDRSRTNGGGSRSCARAKAQAEAGPLMLMMMRRANMGLSIAAARRIAKPRCSHDFASRGAERPKLCRSLAPIMRAQGMPGARCTRGLVCKIVRRCAHEDTGEAEASDIPCAMALRLMPCSPGRRVLFVTLVGEYGLVRPGRADKSSADLASATDARTTRFCRTLQRRSSACRLSLTGLSPARPAIACHAQRCRVHRIPSRVRDDRDPPLLPGETGGVVGVICPTC